MEVMALLAMVVKTLPHVEPCRESQKRSTNTEAACRAMTLGSAVKHVERCRESQKRSTNTEAVIFFSPYKNTSMPPGRAAKRFPPAVNSATTPTSRPWKKPEETKMPKLQRPHLDLTWNGNVATR